MKTLFSDPVGWSGAAVGSWPRFVFMCVAMAGAVLGLVSVASSLGARSALSWHFP